MTLETVKNTIISLSVAEQRELIHFMLNQLIPFQQAENREQTLIHAIKNGGPALEVYQRHDALLKKSVNGTMTPTENKELQQLIPRIEEWAVERTTLFIELSKLWNIPVAKVMQRIDIKTSTTIYG